MARAERRRSRRAPVELDARMEAALDDDMNTAAALAVLYDFAGARRACASPSQPGLRSSGWAIGSTSSALRPNDSWLEETRVGARAGLRRAAATRAARGARSMTARCEQRVDGLTPQEAIERIVVLRNEARRS